MGEWADENLDKFLAGDYEDDEPTLQSDECKYCALPGLHWEKNTKNRWRLFDIHGNIHTCSERPISRHAEQLRKLPCLTDPDFGPKKR